MNAAVIIPYRPQSGHAVLAWTLEGYLSQQLDAGNSLEIHVGIDGGDIPAEIKNLSTCNANKTSVCAYPWMGAAAVRNALARQASPHADMFIFGNADARPDPDMVQQHMNALRQLPTRTLVLGSAPWERMNPTVMDALVDQTPMVFSYCLMRPAHLYSFRVAYTINLSVRREDFESCGGFHEQFRPYGYEDFAFACRMLGPERLGILYHPQARVLHRHPMTFDQYLDREELLGMMTPILARVCPEAFAALMDKRDIDETVKECRAKTQTDRSLVRRLYEKLKNRFAEPESSLGAGEARRRNLQALFQWQIPVKLLAFRLGVLRGMDYLRDDQWRQRKPDSLWRRFIFETQTS